MPRMSDNEWMEKMVKATEDAFKELAPLAKKDILKSFDQEIGYRENGEKVTWKPLTKEYVNRALPKGRGGSTNPMLVFPGSGKLRSGINVIAEGMGLIGGVFNERSGISEYLEGKRPHTNESPEFGGIVSRVLAKHWDRVQKEDYDRQR